MNGGESLRLEVGREFVEPSGIASKPGDKELPKMSDGLESGQKEPNEEHVATGDEDGKPLTRFSIENSW